LGDANGGPQKNRLSKEDASYKGNKKLRGRKFYLHQIPPNPEYWSLPNGGAIRECMAVTDNEAKARSKQNRSIRNWILPDRRFKFNIRVENLTQEELGALMTLLTLPGDAHFKLGYAKPLGLGSVRLRLDLPEGASLPVFTGRERARRYCAFDAAPCGGLDTNAQKDIILRYKTALLPNPPVLPDPPAVPESWRDSQQCPGDGFDLIREDGAASERLGALWKDTLQKGAQTFPIEMLGDYKDLLDPNDKETLQNAYGQDKRAYDKNMGKFLSQRQTAIDAPYSRLPFIDAFNKALKGKPAQEVYYPRNQPNDKGYEWFSKNESIAHQQLVHAYSLPAMGEKLQETF
jgi:hypothetical protein